MPQKEAELTVAENKFFKLEYKLFFTLAVGLVSLGIYVGSMQRGLASTTERLDRLARFMLEMSADVKQIAKDTAHTKGVVDQMNKEK